VAPIRSGCWIVRITAARSPPASEPRNKKFFLDSAQGTFGWVVVDAQTPISNVEAAGVPPRQRILQGLGQIGLRRQAPALFLQPGFEIGEDRQSMIAANLLPLVGGLAFDLGLDRIQLADAP
jgi:hypothetical protein